MFADRCGGRRRRTCGFQEAAPLGDSLCEGEVPAQPRPQTDPDRRVGRVAGVGQRGPEVVVLQLQPSGAGQPVGPAKLGPRGVGHGREVLGVHQLSRAEGAGLGQLLDGVLADGVEQVVARSTVWERRREDRLVHQRAQQLRRPRGIDLAPSGGGEHCRQWHPAAEHRQLVQQRPFVRVQEVMAPGHDGAQVALGDSPAISGLDKQRPPTLERRQDLAQPQDADACGRQLDRQRQPVQPPADLRRQGEAVLGQRQPWP